MKIVDNILVSVEESDISPDGEVVVPKGVIRISPDAFKKFSNIIKIILPNSIEKLEPETFKDSVSLEYVQMPQRLDAIPAGLFKNCKSLKEVKMPELYRAIEQSAFEGCISLAEFDFPETLRVIGDEAFFRCDSFKNITIPQNVTHIGFRIFRDCSELESVRFLNKDIPFYGFINCPSLKSVYFDKEIFEVPNSCFSNCPSLSEVVFNKKCSRISSFAFAHCSSLENITLPEGLTQIDGYAFEYCENLKQVIFPKTTKKIFSNAFYGCDSLDNFTVPATVDKFFPSKSDSMLFFNKTDDWFYLSSEQKPDSIPTQYLNIDYIFLTKYWDYKDIILRDQKNPCAASFYSNFVYKLPREQAIDIIQNHNFKFLNQFNNLRSTTLENEEAFNLLYDLGAVSKPVEVNGKTIDYAQKVVNFLLPKSEKSIFFFTDLVYHDLGGLSSLKSEGLKPEFTDFFLENFNPILEECTRDKNFLTKSYNNFYEVQRTNTSNRGSQRQLKPTIEKFKSYFLDSKFKGVNDETRPIARKIVPYFDSQTTFDRAVEIDKKRKGQNIRDNILHKPLSEKDVFAGIDDYASKIPTAQAKILGDLGHIADNEFTFEWLQKNDPDNFILGKYCSCCAHLEGAGYGIMHASIIHPHVQNLVIKNKNGDIVAKSTLYINKNRRYGVCNNVEIANSVSKDQYEQIYQKYILGIQEFARAYNKEHSILSLKQINVGMGRNDLEEHIKAHRSKSLLPYGALNYGKYGIDGKRYNGDSFMNQYVIWSAKEDAKMQQLLKEELSIKKSNPNLDEDELEENQNSQPA